MWRRGSPCSWSTRRGACPWRSTGAAPPKPSASGPEIASSLGVRPGWARGSRAKRLPAGRTGNLVDPAPQELRVAFLDRDPAVGRDEGQPASDVRDLSDLHEPGGEGPDHRPLVGGWGRLPVGRVDRIVGAHSKELYSLASGRAETSSLGRGRGHRRSRR